MENEAFVYIWKNLSNNYIYIGYHKGSHDDGYVCSSSSERFWNDFRNPNMKWIREIVYEGTRDECLAYEQNLLKEIDLKLDKYYNNARGSNIIFTDEVREKIKSHHSGKSSGMKGKKHSEETKRKTSLKLKGRIFTQEHLEKLRKPQKNPCKKRKTMTKEHIENIKKAIREKRKNVVCPHCNLECSPANSKRWHFDNCKNKQ